MVDDWPTPPFGPECAMKSEPRPSLQNRNDYDAGIGEGLPWWRLMKITRIKSAVRTVYVFCMTSRSRMQG
jgi:hypothetical protein